MSQHVSGKSCLILSTAITVGLNVPLHAQETQTEGFSTNLGRIVVGAGAPKVAIDAPQSITVLEEEDIARVQSGTIGDVLENSPGISTVGSESRFGESFNIRGIGGGTSADEPRIVTLIDGVKKYYESYRQGSLFTDPEFFKNVEILRGPSSSTLYGAGAIGGVIALETRDAADFLEAGDPFAFDQKVEFKSNGSVFESTSFLAFAPNERSDILLGAIYDTSSLQQDGSGNDIIGTEQNELNFLAKGTFSFGDSLEHTVEAGYIRYRGEADSQPLDVVELVTVTGGFDFGFVDREVEDDTAFVKYGYSPLSNGLINLEAQIAYSNSAQFVSNFTSPASASSFDSDYKYETISTRLQNQSEWFGDGFENFLTVGIDYSNQDRITLRDTAANAQFQPEGTTSTIGVFAQNELVLNERVTVLTGARVDFQNTSPGPLVPTDEDVSGTGLAGTFALHYQTTEEVAVFGSVSYTERLPVVDELYDSRAAFPGAADQPAVGTLRNEKSLNFELGAS